MNSRDAQDVILRLLADGPFRTSTMSDPSSLPPDVALMLARVDLSGLERFGRFLCRHYYRERVVHYFKYSRALAPLTGHAPEAALKAPDFNALMPQLVLGARKSAERVLEVIRRHLSSDAESIRARVPFWDDLIAYQSVFFLSDAAGEPQALPQFAARSETAAILELSWDLPTVLPRLVRPFRELPMPEQKTMRLLFARSEHGEVTVLRCSDALKELLEGLTGKEDPAQVAARLGLAHESFEKTLRRLEQMGAVIVRESFSASHVGSELGHGAGARSG